jgi:hypothetical protein
MLGDANEVTLSRLAAGLFKYALFKTGCDCEAKRNLADLVNMDEEGKRSMQSSSTCGASESRTEMPHVCPPTAGLKVGKCEL